MSNYSKTAKDFLAYKIPLLLAEGYPPKQAKAIALSYARKARLKVPSAKRNSKKVPKKSKRSNPRKCKSGRQKSVLCDVNCQNTTAPYCHCVGCGVSRPGLRLDTHGYCAICYRALNESYLKPHRENPDEDLRRLERLATQGDQEALQKLRFERARRISTPKKSKGNLKASVEQIRKVQIALEVLALERPDAVDFYASKFLSRNRFLWDMFWAAVRVNLLNFDDFKNLNDDQITSVLEHVCPAVWKLSTLGDRRPNPDAQTRKYERLAKQGDIQAAERYKAEVARLLEIVPSQTQKNWFDIVRFGNLVGYIYKHGEYGAIGPWHAQTWENDLGDYPDKNLALDAVLRAL